MTLAARIGMGDDPRRAIQPHQTTGVRPNRIAACIGMINEALINVDQTAAELPRAVASRIGMFDRACVILRQDVADNPNLRDQCGAAEMTKKRRRQTRDPVPLAPENTTEIGDGGPIVIGRHSQISR